MLQFKTPIKLNILSTISIFLLILILLVGTVLSVIETTQTFNGQDNPYNISFSRNENHSYALRVPMYAYEKNITLTITGRSLS